MPFDPGLSTLSDHIRLAIGDTGTPPALADATIAALLNGATYPTALIGAARAMRVWLSQQPDTFDEGSRGLRMIWAKRDLALVNLIEDAQAGKITDPTVPVPMRGAIGKIHQRATHGLLGGTEECFRQQS